MSSPELISDLSEGCIKAVEKSLSLQLDRTQDTLPILDHYLRGAKTDNPDVLRLTAQMAGAYFGELAATLGPATWKLPDGPDEVPELHFGSIELVIHPVELALEAVLEEAVDGGPHILIPSAYASAVESSIEHMGPVDPDDFYRLTMRLEVIEQAYFVITALKSKEAN